MRHQGEHFYGGSTFQKFGKCHDLQRKLNILTRGGQGYVFGFSWVKKRINFKKSGPSQRSVKLSDKKFLKYIYCFTGLVLHRVC